MEISSRKIHSLYCDDISCLSKAHCGPKEEERKTKLRKWVGGSTRQEETLRKRKADSDNSNHTSDSESTTSKIKYCERSPSISTDSGNETDKTSNSTSASKVKKAWIRRWTQTPETEIYHCESCNNEYQDLQALKIHKTQCSNTVISVKIGNKKIKIEKILFHKELSTAGPSHTKASNEDSSDLSIGTTDNETSTNPAPDVVIVTDSNSTEPSQPPPKKQRKSTQHILVSIKEFVKNPAGLENAIKQCTCALCFLAYAKPPKEPHKTYFYENTMHFVCGFCQTTTHSELYFYNHLEQMHYDFKKFYCYCGRAFTGFHNFLQHQIRAAKTPKNNNNVNNQ